MPDDKIIEVPGIGNVSFPGAMSDADIAAAIKKDLWQRSVKSRAGAYFNPPAPPPLPLIPPADLPIPESPVVQSLRGAARDIAASEVQAAARRPAMGVMPGFNMGPEAQDLFNRGLARTAGAGMQAAAVPAIAIGAVTAPVATGLGLAGGYLAQRGTEYGLDAAGVPEGTKELLGTGAGLVGGGLAAHYGAPPVEAGIRTAVPVVANAADATAIAVKGAAKGALEATVSTRGGLKGLLTDPANVHKAVLHGAATALTHYGLPEAAGLLEGGNIAYGAYQGARTALGERAAANAAQSAADAVNARIAATRENPIQGPELPPTPATAPAPVEPIAPDAESLAAQRTARQEVNAKIVAARKAKEATSPAAAGAAEDPLLEQLSLSQLKKPLKKATPAERASLESVAARVRAAQPVAAASPVVPGTPAGAAPAALPATPPATPPSPAGAALPENLQMPALPAQIAPSAPAPVSRFQPSVGEPSAASTRPTEHVPLGRVEFYPEGGPSHIPTPGELGRGVYVPEGTEMDSSTLSHLRAENEKGYNAAHYAYSQGITDPKALANLTKAEQRTFMQEAVAHGRAVGNPVPKIKYNMNRETGTWLAGKTLRLAQEHLQKMVDEGGPQAPAPGQLARPETAAETVEQLRPELPAPVQPPGPAAAVNKAIDSLEESHPPNPDNSNERVLMSGGKKIGSFEVAERDGRLRIRSIQATEPGSGTGNLILSRILRAADKFGVPVELTAASTGHQALNSSQLEQWYGRHGFEPEPGYDPALGYMVRKTPAKAHLAKMVEDSQQQ